MPVNKSDLRFFECLADMLEKSGEPPSQDITIGAVRHMAKQFSCFVDSPADIPFEDRLITIETGRHIRLRYYPYGNKVGPVIIYFPGNAFIHDFFEENHSIISKIAHYAGCHAIMVESRLAPEHPYPAPLEDALAATQYIIDHVDDFHIDRNKIILAGYSSGANVAAVITNQLKKSDSIKIYHQFLISGAYDYTNSLHDYDDYVLQDKMLDPASAQFSFDCYSTSSQRKEPTCSPYWEKEISGLPPTTIMVGEYDGGRSQSEGYAKKLIDAGNRVEKLVLSGQTHGTILYRKICSDGEDPAIAAGNKIKNLIKEI